MLSTSTFSSAMDYWKSQINEKKYVEEYESMFIKYFLGSSEYPCKIRAKMYYDVSKEEYTKAAEASNADYRDEVWKNLFVLDIAYKSVLASIEKSKKVKMETRRHLLSLVNMKETRHSRKTQEETSGCVGKEMQQRKKQRSSKRGKTVAFTIPPAKETQQQKSAFPLPLAEKKRGKE